jgi:short subunit dehydrogenase-like uncharacterized protein
MIARFGAPATSVTAFFGETKGGASGGTIASMMTIAEELAADPGLRRLMANPYALDPATDVVRPQVKDVRTIGYDKRLGMITAPFFMADVNTRVVRRGHALAGFPWGAGFQYAELMSAPRSARGLAIAATMTAGLGGMLLAMASRPLREALGRRLPQPGEGPDQRTRERGYFTVRLLGEIEGRPDASLRYRVSDHADPGYGSTSKMLGEAALCLALDELPRRGGCLTPSVAMGGKLVERLRTAGLTFAPDQPVTA